MKSFETETQNIFFLEADINYTIIYFLDGSKYLSSSTLKRHEEKLSKDDFFRINRSQLVNRNFIATCELAKDHLRIRLKNGLNLKSSRRRTSALKMLATC